MEWEFLRIGWDQRGIAEVPVRRGRGFPGGGCLRYWYRDRLIDWPVTQNTDLVIAQLTDGNSIYWWPCPLLGRGGTT